MTDEGKPARPQIVNLEEQLEELSPEQVEQAKGGLTDPTTGYPDPTGSYTDTPSPGRWIR